MRASHACALQFVGSFLLLSSLLSDHRALAADPAVSQWVHPGPDGKLVYKTTPAGDRVMDFSYAGYMGGGVPLPTVPVKRTVKPSGGEDDAPAIQAAINEVAALPLEGDFRGAVLLAPGTFNCASTIVIPASGVVLRGSGSGAEQGDKTTLKLVGRPHLGIAIHGMGWRYGGSRDPANGDNPPGGDEQKLAETKITDAYVPSGALSFKVADAKGFAAGDSITITKPITAAWVKFMGMDDLVRDGRPQTWLRPGRPVVTERTIAKIEGNTITLDVPLSDNFDATYTNPTGTVVAKVRPVARLTQCGIENLHLECAPQEINHTQSHYTALRLSGQDCWVRDVVADETMDSIAVGGRRITLTRVAVNRKAMHQGSSKPAEFAPNASQVLLDRCTASGDNIWYAATGAGVAGPIVLLNCTFTGNGRAESHQRWSTGLLYDNCHAPSGGLDFRNRGEMGSGHGWTMGWGVAWNCEAQSYVIQNPPGSANWMIGCIGASTPMPRPFGAGPNLPEGIIDSPGKNVAPQSLYLAQLAERLGPQAVKNIGY